MLPLYLLSASLAFAQSTVEPYLALIGSHSGDFRVHQRTIGLTSDGLLAFNQSQGFEFLVDDTGYLNVTSANFKGSLSLQNDNTLKVDPVSFDKFTVNSTVFEVNLGRSFVACIDNSLIYWAGDGSVPDCKTTVGVGLLAAASDNAKLTDIILGYQ